MTTSRSVWLLYTLALFIRLNDAKPSTEKFVMDKMCGNEPLILDGDDRPGAWFQLTSSSKYKSNMACTIKFRTALQSQRFVVTVEKMDITDCPGDTLHIYDGSNLLNKNIGQQCGSPASFTFTTTTAQLSFTFTSNKAVESSGFRIAIALHFPMIAQCPQSDGFFLCKNKNCISKKLQCDSHNHCGDNTDELTCSILPG
jgi:hypothetical protein